MVLSTEFAIQTALHGAHIIDGVQVVDGERLERFNPARPEQLVGDFPLARTAVIERAVQTADHRRQSWQASGPIARAGFVQRLADLLERDRESLAATISAEHGKTIAEAHSEVSRSIELARFVAGMGRRLTGQTLPADDPNTWSSTSRHPIGVVALVTPWNFPLAIPLWKLAPALVAGCTVVLKPSPLAPFSAARLVELVHEAGVPAGVVNLVYGDQETGSLLVAHPLVAGVSFTGSVEVGRRIHSATAPSFKRTQLEMGGKNAVIVMPDADLEKAADAVAFGAFGQAGQRCSATSRVIIHRDVVDEMLRLLSERATALQLGDPLSPFTDIGPLISATSLERCVEAVAEAVREGAHVVAGGEAVALEGGGYFMQPTIVRNVGPHTRLALTEVFGPVLVVLECGDFDEAIALNNSVIYGMSATLFSTSLPLIGRFLQEASAGMLHVNRPGVGAYPHMPHVGTKSSQLGAAECSTETLDFFTEIRTATIDVS